MSIPISSTTITVKRTNQTSESGRDPWGEGYATGSDTTKTWSTVATGIRAVIAPGAGSTQGAGDTQVYDFTLQCDPTDLAYYDRVVDEPSGQEFEVLSAYTHPGVAGLAHTVAGLRYIKGFGQTGS